jgi:hypothetical protein
MKPAQFTTVTIIGTYHGSMCGMRHYTPSKLKELIQNSKPEVLAVEVRPEDYNAGRTVNNPWDMNEVVLPYANENNIPVEPIDWLDNTRSMYAEAIEKLKQTPEGKKILLEIEDEWAPHAAEFPNFSEVTPEYVHSELFAQRETEYRLREKALLGEGPQNLMWYTRADAINKNLSTVLKKHPGKRITVVVGASHRPDIELFLRTQTDLEIQILFR